MAEHKNSENTSAQTPTPDIDPKTNRVSSDYLSCEIPEGWEASVNPIDAHYAFEMRPEGASEDDGVAILCIRTEPYEEELRSIATPELLLALKKATFFSLDNANKPFVARPLDYYEVEGQGCRCAVMEVRIANNDGFEFYLFQDGSRGDWLRATFYSWDEDQRDEARTIVNKLASSMHAPRMETPECIRAFQECLDEKVEPERFRELVEAYARPLAVVRSASYTIAAYMMETYNPSVLSSAKRVRAALEQFASFNEYAEPYLERIADAADAQARHYEGGSEQLGAIRSLAASVIGDTPITPDNVNHDSISLSEHDLQQNVNVIKQVMREGAIIAGHMANPSKSTRAAIEKTLAPSERMLTLFSRLGITLSEPEQPAAPAEPKWQSASCDVDIPSIMMSLLSDELVSFDDSDLPRRKEHHLVVNVQVHDARTDDLSRLARQCGLADTNELLESFLYIMREVEKDEAFFVPKKAISKGLYRAVRKGDLTGATFANIANYKDSFRIRCEAPNAYLVEYGEAVAIGIPRFFGMACRLVWDLRQCVDSLREVPFSVRFSRIEATHPWWEYPKATFVDGAQDDPVQVNVTSAPSPDLSEGIEPADGQPESVAAEFESMDLPTTMLTLLSDGYVTFGEKSLSWSKGHHVIRGTQTDPAMLPRLSAIARVNGLKDTNNLLDRFKAFMKEVEKDKELIIPKASISKALSPIVRRGDLTGITLANLAASGAAFRVRNASPNEYAVAYDESLSDGIPRFFDLMCRLLWDLRQCVKSLEGIPFRVTFTGCHSIDLAQSLRGKVSRVDGAQNNPGSVSVSEAPAGGLSLTANGRGKETSKPKGAPKAQGKQARGKKRTPQAIPEATSAQESESMSEPASPRAAKFELLNDQLGIVVSRATELEAAKQELQSIFEQSRDTRDELNRLDDQKSKLVSEANSIEKKLKWTSRKLEITVGMREKNLAQREELRRDQSALLSARDNVQSEIAQLEEREQAKKTEIKSLGFFAFSKKREAKDKLQVLTGQQNEARKRLEELEGKQAKTESSLEQVGKLLGSSLSDDAIDGIKQEIQELETELKNRSSKIEEATKEIKSCKGRLANDTKKRQRRKSNLNAKTSELQRAIDRYNTVAGAMVVAPAYTRSDEYRAQKEHMVATLEQLKTLGVKQANRRVFPKLALEK